MLISRREFLFDNPGNAANMILAAEKVDLGDERGFLWATIEIGDGYRSVSFNLEDPEERAVFLSRVRGLLDEFEKALDEDKKSHPRS